MLNNMKVGDLLKNTELIEPDDSPLAYSELLTPDEFHEALCIATDALNENPIKCREVTHHIIDVLSIDREHNRLVKSYYLAKKNMVRILKIGASLESDHQKYTELWSVFVAFRDQYSKYFHQLKNKLIEKYKSIE